MQSLPEKGNKLMTNLRGKTALVTGSARGIGKAIAERLASRGANIVVNYSNDEKSARETVEDIKSKNVRAISLKADVSKVDEIEALFSMATQEFGKLDIVVANAGKEVAGQSILETTEADFDRVLAVNVKGVYFTLQNAARHVADNGRIIYVGSSATAFPIPGLGLYGGSKMAPRLWVEVLAKEIGHRGVTVNSILPTGIEGAGVFTNLPPNDSLRKMVIANSPRGRMGTVDDVADAAEYLAGHLSSFVSGQHLLVTGGASY
jgi:3-oxoacyl-[acyl-carrier protein] reductase